MDRKRFREFLHDNFDMTDDVIMDRIFKYFNKIATDDFFLNSRNSPPGPICLELLYCVHALLEGTKSDTSKIRDLFLFENACIPIVSNTSA